MNKVFISIVLMLTITGVYALDIKYAPIVNAALSNLKTTTKLSLLKGHIAVNISSGNKELDGQFAESIQKAYPNFASKADTVHHEDLYQMMVKVYRENNEVYIYTTVTNFEQKKTVERTAKAKSVSAAVLETLQHKTAIHAKNEFEAYLDFAFAGAGAVVQNAQPVPPPPKAAFDWSKVVNTSAYFYTSAGLLQNVDESKLEYPEFGINILEGYNYNYWGVYLGGDFLFADKNWLGGGLISMFILGIPLRISIVTVKPYAGLGVDFTFLNPKNDTNYMTTQSEDSSWGVDFEVGLQVMIDWFSISAAYRQRFYPSYKIEYEASDNRDTAASTEELFLKRFVISIGFIY